MKQKSLPGNAHYITLDTIGCGSRGKLALSIAITSMTLVAELIAGMATGSLALLSDAAHVFLVIFALGLSYGAVRFAAKAPNASHSYGFSRMKVIAAFINGATLLLFSVEIFREAIERFMNPAPVQRYGPRRPTSKFHLFGEMMHKILLIHSGTMMIVQEHIGATAFYK